MADGPTTMPQDGDLECRIDCLTADELLLIFHFLTLYERLMAMRVCKKWYHILGESQAWTIINFNEKGLVKKKLPSNDFSYNDWWFPRNENDILDFLALYAGGSLRDIHFSLVTSKILAFVRKNCPNLKTVSLITATTDNKSLQTSGYVKEALYIPLKIQRFYLNADVCTAFPPSEENQESAAEHRSPTEQVLNALSKRPNLRYLWLKNVWVPKASMQELTTKNKKLQEIHLIFPVTYHSFQHWPYRRRSHRDNGAHKHEIDDVLTVSVGTLTTLKNFKIYCYTDVPELKSKCYHELGNFLMCIGKWEHLKVLSLKGVQWSDDAFKSMIPGIVNLESLELECSNSITSSTIKLVGRHLKKIKYLELGNGVYSNNSLKSLLSHPALEEVSLFKDIWNQEHTGKAKKLVACNLWCPDYTS